MRNRKRETDEQTDRNREYEFYFRMTSHIWNDIENKHFTMETKSSKSKMIRKIRKIHNCIRNEWKTTEHK